jgi:hypothetical protein
MKIIFGSYMKIGAMENSQGYYDHEEEIRGLHVSRENAETKSNVRRGREETVELSDTMRSMQREVQSYRVDNENIMKD